MGIRHLNIFFTFSFSKCIKNFLTSGSTVTVRPSIRGACLEVILQQKIMEVIFYKDGAEVKDKYIEFDMLALFSLGK